MKKLTFLTLAAVCTLVMAAPAAATTTASLDAPEVLEVLPVTPTSGCVVLADGRDDPEPCPEEMVERLRELIEEICGPDGGRALYTCYLSDEYPDLIFLHFRILCGSDVEVIAT